MSGTIENEKPTTTRTARYVRFTPDEYDQILEDERIADKSAQELLKRAYFGKGPLVILMTDDDKDRMCSQIHRIGNNVNQIARKINSGFSYGFNKEIEDVRAQLTALLAWMTSKYRANRA